MSAAGELRALRAKILADPRRLLGHPEPPIDLVFGHARALTDAIDVVEGRPTSAWLDFLAARNYGARLEYRWCMDKHGTFAERVSYLSSLFADWDTWCQANSPPAASAESRLAALEAAVRRHRAAVGHDRCHENDDELYAALGDGAGANHVLPPKCEWMANCEAYWESRRAVQPATAEPPGA